MPSVSQHEDMGRMTQHPRTAALNRTLPHVKKSGVQGGTAHWNLSVASLAQV